MNAAKIDVMEDKVELTVVAQDGPRIFTLDIIPDLKTTLTVQDCSWCSKPFVVSAVHQKFCGVRCRITAHRKKCEPNVQQFYEREVIREQDALRELAG